MRIELAPRASLLTDRRFIANRGPTKRTHSSHGDAPGVCGVVVVPTGSGQTDVAVVAIDCRRRSAPLDALTLDLVRQWYDLLRTTMGATAGVIVWWAAAAPMFNPSG